MITQPFGKVTVNIFLAFRQGSVLAVGLLPASKNILSTLEYFGLLAAAPSLKNTLPAMFL